MDWFEEDDTPLPENGSRQLKGLGENEGLEKGLQLGELKGYADGFKSEATRALELGKVLGAAKFVFQKSGKLEAEIKELEDAARDHWSDDTALVRLKIEKLQRELKSLGINLTI